MRNIPPPLPHEELLQICKTTIGNSVWAIEMGSEGEGELFWRVYCSNKKAIKKIPKTFRGRPIYAVFCEKPSLES